MHQEFVIEWAANRGYGNSMPENLNYITKEDFCNQIWHHSLSSQIIMILSWNVPQIKGLP